MVKLKDKIKMALDESRILVYGIQILLGLEYTSVFQQGFDALPGSSSPTAKTARIRCATLPCLQA